MPSVDEVVSSSQYNAVLRAAIAQISGDQQVTFMKYTKKILPLDGFVFWVLSSLMGDATPPQQIAGSLHLHADKRQNDTEVFSQVGVTFSSKVNASQFFQTLGPDDLLVGTSSLDDGSALPVRFAFSRLGFYQNAGIWHYAGTAVFPHMLSQFIDTAPALAALTNSSQILSNSMPAWMYLSNYTPTLPAYGFGNQVPLYPSLLVTPNSVPPFGSVHIPPDATEAVAALPFLDRLSNHAQLARDRVRVTFYGVDNPGIMNFLDCVLQYSQDYGVIGLAGMPVVRDDVVGQPEVAIRAAKKSVAFDVSYYQQATRNVARQLILKATSAVTARPPTFPAAPVVA